MKKQTFIYATLLLLSGSLVYLPANADDTKGLQRLQQVAKFQQENKVAVIVGINAYERSTGLRPLRYAAADANNLRNTLIAQGYKVRLLTNQNAGKYRILDAIEQAGKTLRKGTGTFIFAYSGHGFSSRNKNYLASYGTVVNKLAQSALPLSEVQQAIRKSGAKRAMLFIDACRNDPNIAGSKAVGNVGFIYTKSQGMKTLYATKFGEVSWESPQLQHGVFSHFLIKALSGEAADGNGIISFGTVESYVQDKVSNWTFSHRMPNTQLPFSNGRSFGVLVLGQKGNHRPPVNPELAFWQAQSKCNQLACYQNYIRRYPKGKYIQQARTRITQIQQQNAKKQEQLRRQRLQAQQAKQRHNTAVINTTRPQQNFAFEPQMQFIRGGSFMMGSPASEKERSDNEKQHRVIVGDFWMAKTETTFKQWQVCVDDGGCQSNKKPDDMGWGRGNRPVINVSWHDANEYAQWLSQKTGKNYRLPTEAQWEYAARGGTSTAYSFGNSITTRQANFNFKLGKTAPVGSYPVNQYGLQDMHGNVYEWTCSAYVSNYNGSESKCANRNDSRSRVLRGGGSWSKEPRYVRSANRNSYFASDRIYFIGFRLSRTH